MTRDYRITNLANKRVRHSVEYRESVREVDASVFLTRLIQGDMLRCGPVHFEVLHMVKEGDEWVVKVFGTDESGR